MSGSSSSVGVAGTGGGGGVGAVGGQGAAGSGVSSGPCGACKFLRRKCVSGCIFAPYFDSEQGATHFAAVHKVFGASNVSKLLLHIPAHRRLDAVVTICYEAQARLRDPVYGCVAHVLALQQQVVNLQAELSYLRAQVATLEQPPPPMAHAHQPPLHSPSFCVSDLSCAASLSASLDDLSTLFDAPAAIPHPTWPPPPPPPQQQQKQQEQRVELGHLYGSGGSGSLVGPASSSGGSQQELPSEFVGDGDHRSGSAKAAPPFHLQVKSDPGLS